MQIFVCEQQQQQQQQQKIKQRGAWSKFQLRYMIFCVTCFSKLVACDETEGCAWIWRYASWPAAFSEHLLLRFIVTFFWQVTRRFVSTTRRVFFHAVDWSLGTFVSLRFLVKAGLLNLKMKIRSIKSKPNMLQHEYYPLHSTKYLKKRYFPWRFAKIVNG